ncbi:hypothetical protein ACQHIV_10290 [Kribbella sp. GL6]|uniref:hypothetical protein n=1 Tax=Kribbella sp. GL6 TaxID=3419765 RepID=UPI003D0344D5
MPEHKSERREAKVRYKGTLLAAALATGAVLVLTAAGLNSPGDHKTAAAPAKGLIRVSYVKSYSSLTELRADSSAIVEITAGKQHPEDIAGLPVTVTTAVVKKVIWGKISAASAIELRQVGTSSAVGENTSKLLVPGTEYLVFVVPSTGAIDAAPDRLLITGDAGVYELRQEQYLYRGGNADPERGNSLPTALQADTAVSVVTS